MNPIMIIGDLDDFSPPQNKSIILFYDRYMDRLGGTCIQQAPSGFHPVWGYGDRKIIAEKLAGFSPAGASNALRI